jgi:hypothetical protein
LAIGLILILLGAWLLVNQVMPGILPEFSWPWIIVGVGVLLLLIGLLSGNPGMAVPACIVGGIGGLLYWQSITGNWESWAYAWTLIPGFVGVGVALSGLLEGRIQKGVREASGLIFISLILFTIFGSFFGAFGLMGNYWPVLLILLGLLLLVRAMFRAR